jgi:hypothetical protein
MQAPIRERIAKLREFQMSKANRQYVHGGKKMPGDLQVTQTTSGIFTRMSKTGHSKPFWAFTYLTTEFSFLGWDY